ncbi:hypothetical protein L9F63_025381, partial [Diploptera punctata]
FKFKIYMIHTFFNSYFPEYSVVMTENQYVVLVHLFILIPELVLVLFYHALMDPCKCMTFGVSSIRICFLVQVCSLPCIVISPIVP